MMCYQKVTRYRSTLNMKRYEHLKSRTEIISLSGLNFNKQRGKNRIEVVFVVAQCMQLGVVETR